MKNNSELWEKLISNEFSNVTPEFLSNFRAPGAANKFVAWDPFEKSLRYFKFLLYTVALKQELAFFERYKKIESRELGNPISVMVKGCNIDADYFAAVEEFMFLENSMPISEVREVVEIGAGFGRTCHTILTLCPYIKCYVIIDLPSMINLSRRYLEICSPELIKKVKFISSEDLNEQTKLTPDLTINIDSFQEMTDHIIDGYMDRVIKKSKWFYSKNAVGKYLPSEVGMPDLGREKIMDVFDLGRCKDLVNIFDEFELEKARKYCLKAYMPSFDAQSWDVLNQKPMDLFPYFHHVLYHRTINLK